jgi:hypothetical protein
MTRGVRHDWVAPTLILCGLWLVTTGAVVALTVVAGPILPGFVAKSGPFFVAGFGTGRLAAGSSRRSRTIAAAVVAIVSAAAWTAFSAATTDLAAERSLLLLAVSLPVHALGGLWSYLGMALGSPRSTAAAPAATTTESEVDDLERELKDEIERERASDRSARDDDR